MLGFFKGHEVTEINPLKIYRRIEHPRLRWRPGTMGVSCRRKVRESKRFFGSFNFYFRKKTKGRKKKVFSVSK